MKRFYKATSVDRDDAGWLVKLDARPLPTPAKAPLRLPTAALAQALADEWGAQGEKIDAERMPIMTLVATALDRVAHHRELVVRETAAYAGNDLVCYWAERPEKLVQRQAAHWQPVLDWATAQFPPGLVSTAGIIHVEQDAAVIAAIAARLEQLDDFRLNACTQLTQSFGSTLIALMVIERALDIDAACDAAFVDDRYQEETWGYDKEANDRIAGKVDSARAVDRFLTLLS